MLLNNAQRNFLIPLVGAEIEEAKEPFDVNFWNVVAVTNAFTPMLIDTNGILANHSSIVWNLLIPWGDMWDSA
ncbi:hypothetical protein DL770_002639 [Monosporascus sp. CRB-9-2]|nr:hypothetical protein DL770_002639 [Monosporascus sp. CRB-9-2]